VFLREIAKRLLEGLKPAIPDLQSRIDHIFQKQLYGIAITELTSFLARRSVYCSKYPNSIYSVSKFKNADGNIRYKRIQHKWQDKKCIFCGASKEQYDRGDILETHAYELIHTTKPEDIFKMKFDVIISNPPYQLEDGGFGDSAKPIYNFFVEQAKKLNPSYLSMIIPARWYAGGKGLDHFREDMLNDKRIKELHDFPETSDCFPGLNVRGGICYFLWAREYNGKCNVVNHKGGHILNSDERELLEPNSDTFIRYNEAIEILHKVQALGEETMESHVSSRKPFGLSTNYTNFSERKTLKNSVLLYRNGGQGYISEGEVIKNTDLINKIKVIVSKASPGSDEYPHLVFSEPIIAVNNTVCTETYVIVDIVDSIKQGENLKRYMSTQFFRFLVLLMKNTQDVPKRVYRYVPVLDMNIEWSDEKLFKRYNITLKEQTFINTLVKPVEWRPKND
jgi:site-specific DNA-methyltransferase (adenine-specific)